jgi:hypothetical protein
MEDIKKYLSRKLINIFFISFPLLNLIRFILYIFIPNQVTAQERILLGDFISVGFSNNSMVNVITSIETLNTIANWSLINFLGNKNLKWLMIFHFLNSQNVKLSAFVGLNQENGHLIKIRFKYWIQYIKQAIIFVSITFFFTVLTQI